MIRTLVRSALVAVLITSGGLLAPKAALADRGHVTNCNANNPRGGGCPRGIRTAQPNNPVCAKGRHVGNPHCTRGTTTNGGQNGGNGEDRKPRVRSSGTRVRAVTNRTTPRVRKAVAPRRTVAVSTRAGKAL